MMYIVLFIIIAALIMIGTNILYDLAAALIPILAIILFVAGVIVGFVIAVKNTIDVYKDVYM